MAPSPPYLGGEAWGEGADHGGADQNPIVRGSHNEIAGR